MQELSCTLVILATVAVFNLVKSSQARVIVGLSLGVAATEGFSSDRHGTGDRGDHHCGGVCLRVWISVLGSNKGGREIERKKERESQLKCNIAFVTT